MDDTFTRIRDKLAELDRLDPNRTVFSSRTHQYRLNPCLSVEQVEDIERRIGLRLPDQYRRFILEVGDGGPGPGYGVFTLKQALQGEWDPASLAALSQPFPAPTTVAQADEVPGMPPGLLGLCSVGGGGIYCLVLAGSECGRIWVTNAEDWSPAVSESWLLSHPDLEALGFLEVTLRTEPEQRFEFAEWFEDFLSENLPQSHPLVDRV